MSEDKFVDHGTGFTETEALLDALADEQESLVARVAGMLPMERAALVSACEQVQSACIIANRHARRRPI